MVTRTIRPNVQNGSVARRSGRSTERKPVPRKNTNRASTRSKGVRRTGRHQKTASPGDSRVYWLLVIVAAVMASGFIYTLRSKISIHRLGQMESTLKEELDEIANRQRYGILEQQRAINPQQSDSAARQAGLIQPRLVGPRIAPSEQKPAAKNTRINRHQVTKSVIRGTVKRPERQGRRSGR